MPDTPRPAYMLADIGNGKTAIIRHVPSQPVTLGKAIAYTYRQTEASAIAHALELSDAYARGEVVDAKPATSLDFTETVNLIAEVLHRVDPQMSGCRSLAAAIAHTLFRTSHPPTESLTQSAARHWRTSRWVGRTQVPGRHLLMMDYGRGSSRWRSSW